jgi:surface protein
MNPKRQLTRLFTKLSILLVFISGGSSVYAACTVGGTAYNEAGRVGAGVTVVTGTAGGSITAGILKTWSSGDDVTTCDVSSISDMSSLFRNVSLFNQSVDSWDVSSVTNMSYMFSGADNFNQ